MADDKDDWYMVWSNEHHGWWRSYGYGGLKDAGVYTRERAIEICRTALPTAGHIGMISEIPVRVADIAEMMRGQAVPDAVHGRGRMTMGADNQAQKALDRMAALERAQVEVASVRDALAEAMSSYVHARRLAGAEPDEGALERWRLVLGAHASGFNTGDVVVKKGGDYTFEGEVRAVWRKRSGLRRYVVENDAGLAHIFNKEQLRAK